MSNNRDELDCDVDMQGMATGDPVFGINEVAEAMSSGKWKHYVKI